MAGRGRGATLPAWMTQGGGGNNNAESFSISPRGASADNAVDDGHDRGDRKRRSRSRSRDRDDKRYSRDRDRDRDRGRGYKDRSISNDRSGGGGGGGGGGGSGWRPGRKKASNFDVAPLPGEEVQTPSLGFVQPGSSVPTFSGSGGASDSFTKHARKIYIGNLPANTTEDHIRDFFHDVISNCIPRGEIDPYQNHVIQVLNHMDKGFAFVEFSSIELTSAVLLIDGAKYNFRNGSTLIRIRRPNDYKENLVPASTRPPIELCNLEYLGISPNVEGNKLFIANIPYQLTDEEVRTLLIVPGELKAFHLVREPGQSNHKGYGFAEYADKATAERAKLILTTIDFQGKKLTITDASSKVSGSQNPSKVSYGTQMPQQAAHPMNTPSLPQQGGGGHYGSSYGNNANPSSNYGNNANPSSNYGNNANPSSNYGSSNTYNDNYGSSSNSNNYSDSSNYGYNDQYQSYPPTTSYKAPFDQLPPTCVIKLANMVTKEELEDDKEYFDIIEDVRAECSEYGQVVSVLIPRMKDRFPEHTQGSIYVQFRDKNHSRNAAIALSGRKFAERTVVVEYFDEIQFSNRNF